HHADVAAERRRRLDEVVALLGQAGLHGQTRAPLSASGGDCVSAERSLQGSTTPRLKTSCTLNPPAKMFTKRAASWGSRPASRTSPAKSSSATPAARPLIIRSYFGTRSWSRYAWYAARALSRSAPRPAAIWVARSFALRAASPIPWPKIGSLCC